MSGDLAISPLAWTGGKKVISFIQDQIVSRIWNAARISFMFTAMVFANYMLVLTTPIQHMLLKQKNREALETFSSMVFAAPFYYLIRTISPNALDFSKDGISYPDFVEPAFYRHGLATSLVLYLKYSITPINFQGLPRIKKFSISVLIGTILTLAAVILHIAEAALALLLTPMCLITFSWSWNLPKGSVVNILDGSFGHMPTKSKNQITLGELIFRCLKFPAVLTNVFRIWKYAVSAKIDQLQLVSIFYTLDEPKFEITNWP